MQPPQARLAGAQQLKQWRVLFISLITLAAFLQLTSCFFIDQRHSPQQHEWSYQRQHEWARKHRQCNLKAQSPIDIQRRFVILNNQLRLQFYNYNQLTKFKIQNAHHTIKLNPVEAGDHELDQFGVKLGQASAGITARGDNGSVPEIITVDEDVEPAAFETTKQAANISSQPKSKVIVHQQPHNHHQQQQQQNSSGAGGVQVDQHQGNIIGTESDVVNSDNNNDGQQLAYNGAPTIKLDWLDEGNNEFKLRDIHFHWAERRDNGSEHAIDGKRAAMEMHLVHVKHGLDKAKIGFTSDAVAVIAILIESYRKSNADFNPIVNALTRINMSSQVEDIEYKSINDLLPNDLASFYTYSGSLTTPPCYQVVNWIVMSDRLYMNAKQLEMFRNLYAPDEHELEAEGGVDLQQQQAANMIMPNIRQLQPVNNRAILASFAPFGRLENLPSSSLAAAGSLKPPHWALLSVTLLLSASLSTTITVALVTSLSKRNCVISLPSTRKTKH